MANVLIKDAYEGRALARPAGGRRRAARGGGLLALAALALLALLPAGARAQLMDDGFDPGAGPSEAVKAIALQPDGRVIIGGAFQFDGGHIGIARLESNGTLEASFNASADGSVFDVKVQANGHILAAGAFAHVNGQYRPGLVRLHPDGAVDENFRPVVEGTVFSVVEQADGKILVGGYFSRVGGHPATNVARLNPDGTLDATFNAGYGPDFYVLALALQADGHVLLGGMFKRVNGQARSHLARLNPDGSLDMGFNPGANNYVRALAVQADGKILVGGDFTRLTVAVRSRIGRLHPTGYVDNSFATPGANGSVRALALLPGGKLLVGGQFTSINGQLRRNLATLHADGTVTPSDLPAAAPVNDFSDRLNGHVMVGGDFREIAGRPRTFVARLTTGGTLDLSFKANPDGWGYATAIQPDGKIIAGGYFWQIGGGRGVGRARLHPDGSFDTSFGGGWGEGIFINALAVQADGRIVIGGYFGSINEQPRSYLARLHPDGSLDESFDPSPQVIGPGRYVARALAVQSDGRLLVSGYFDRIGGGERYTFARLHPDGSLDPSFNPTPGLHPSAIAVQPDGRILIGGSFADGAGRDALRRLHPDGSLDPSFDAKMQGGRVECMALQANGKIVFAGSFTAVGGKPRFNVARVNWDGSLDTSFNPPPRESEEDFSDIFALAVQADGKVLFSRHHREAPGQYPRYSSFGRLSADGTPDPDFPVQDVDLFVSSLTLQPDGRVLLGRQIWSDQPLLGLMRFYNTNPATQKLTASPSGDALYWSSGGAAPSVERATFEYSLDGVNFHYLGEAERVLSGWAMAGLRLPTSVRFFVRARGFTSHNGSSSIVEVVREFHLSGVEEPATDPPAPPDGGAGEP